MLQRIIKFRAWDNQASRTRDWKWLQELSIDAIFNPDYFILEQFTGLLDKNGKAIYEGISLDSATPTM